MKRFFDAVEATRGVTTLPQLAANFLDAIDEVTLEGGKYVDDPAVLLLGSFIGFHTHFDVNTHSGYDKLLGMCIERIDERPIQ